MYKIIGADGKEYGPVSAEQLRQWLTEGRANSQTRVLAEGSAEWQTLGSVRELATIAPPPISAFDARPANGESQKFEEHDYDLDIGGCISSGWSLLQKNMGLLVGISVIYLLVEIPITVLGWIPLIGPIFKLINFFVVSPLIAAPLLGGVFYCALRIIRNQPATGGDVFEGFRRAFGNLVLGHIVTVVLICLCFLPAILVGILTIGTTLPQDQPPPTMGMLLTMATCFVCLIPAAFISVNWVFAPSLIVDKGLNFWAAMKMSWKQVTKHWWHVFGLLVLAGLINLGGLILCCVGLIFTFPLGIVALMYAYETIFSDGQA